MEFTREVGFRFPLCRGEDVRAIQQALTILQSEPPCGTVDGIFGGATKQAVAEYQRRNSLEPSGVVDAATWSALFKSAADRQKTVPEKAASALVKAAVATPAASAAPAAGAPAAAPAPADLPVSRPQALRTRDWLLRNFSAQIDKAIEGTPVDANLVAAIACKETANVWLSWIDRLSPADVLARCVFDASGDMPGTSRGVFPRNAAEFRAKAGEPLTAALIEEANETRKLRGYSPQPWLYKGYGLFQYDLQHFDADQAFFRDRLWRNFEDCIDRFMLEMRRKLDASKGDLPDAVRRYNGSGPKAEEYRGHVMYIYGWLKDTPPPPLH